MNINNPDEKELEMKTANATRWSTFSEIATKLISPIVNMILARLLTPEDFGVIATVSMVISFADVFSDAGFQKYIVQHDFKSKEELDRVTNIAFWTNFFISLLFFSGICIFNRKIAELVGSPDLGFVIVVSSFSIIISSFSSIQAARYRRDFNFRSLFYIRIVTCSIPLLVTVPLALIFKSYWALVVGSLLNSFCNAVLLLCFSKWKIGFYYNFKILKEMFSYSWWILLESIAVWLTAYIGTFIVGKFLNEYYLGLYKSTMGTVNQIFALITAATIQPLFTALSRTKNNISELQNLYCNYLKAISVLLVPMGAGIWMYRHIITLILLGEQWLEVTDFIGIWGLMSALCPILGYYCNSLFNAVGKTSLSFWAQVLHLAALVPVLYLSAQKGFTTLYISRSLVRLESILVELLIMKIALKFPIKKLISGFIPAFICTGIMCVINYFFMLVSDSFYWGIFGMIFCIIVYFCAMYLLFRSTLLNTLQTFGIDLSSVIKFFKFRKADR